MLLIEERLIEESSYSTEGLFHLHHQLYLALPSLSTNQVRLCCDYKMSVIKFWMCLVTSYGFCGLIAV